MTKDREKGWVPIHLSLKRLRILGTRHLKGLRLTGKEEIFPPNLAEIIKPYWKMELSRLAHSVPEFERVLSELKEKVEL